MEKSNEAKEIEQLKSKIENYRRTLSALKADSSSGDIHLKRRVMSLEKNVEQLNGQIQEFAKLFDEGIAYLTSEIKQLAEKSNEQLLKKKENMTPRKESPQFVLNEHPSNISIQPDSPTSNQQSNVPTFKQLRQLASLHPAVQPVNEPPMTPRYNASAIPTYNSEVHEREAIIQEEMNFPSRGEASDTATSPFGGQISRSSQEFEKSQSTQPPLQLYARDEIQESPFWKKFKKK